MKINTLPIINLTPNSFSDGGVHDNASKVLETFLKARDMGIRYFDIGAESTAPMNQAISGDEEMRRFEEYFYPSLKNATIQNIENLWFGLDTYRYNTFKTVSREIKKRLDKLNKVQTFWNDVGGVVDDDVLEYLADGGRYILCHNLVGKRELSGRHQEFLVPDADDILNSVKNFFVQKLATIPKEFHKNVILDPCFGFSKTKTQNMILLSQLENLISHFKHHDWLVGISRKSFIREEVIKTHNLDRNDKTKVNIYCDEWQKNFFTHLIPKLQNISCKELFLRVHF